jgi:hypothetical protein
VTEDKIAVITITIIACVGALYFAVFSKQISNHLQADIFKITYQFLLIVVAGGGISWLYKDFISIRERKQSDIRAFRDLYSNLVDSYNQYKEIKRLLRAKALRNSDDGEILLSRPYEKLMMRLNSVQLKFEFYKLDVGGKNQFFERVNEKYTCKDNACSLAQDLAKVEEYLNEVVDEYEKALRDYITMPEYLKLDDLKLKKVEEFIAKSKNQSSNREIAKKCFKSAIEKLAEVSDKLE